MASDLLQIAASGARAARGALDVTAQNIANASSDGYVRRSVTIEEVTASGGMRRVHDISLSGSRVTGINRNADMFRQSEVRRTVSDLARSDAELTALQNLEASVDQVGIYQAIVEFEGSLQELSVDPVDPSLRASVIAALDSLANKFEIADSSITSAMSGMQFNAQAGVDQANVITTELARVNLQLSRAGDGSSDQASLLDRRDSLLEQLSGITNINTTFGTNGTVTVQAAGASGPTLVSAGNAASIAMATAADGTISFTAGGTAFTPSGGSLAGNALGLAEATDLRSRLDTVADSVISAVNNSQASGVALDGSAGQPLLTGSGAGGIQLAFSNPDGLATAPAGAGANSRDASNLDALRSALNNSEAADDMNALLFEISSKVSSRELTNEALETIASSARISLQEQAGVDLDKEAANLIRYQQAFQASGRAMQVAKELFDTLVAIG
ncbi:flagellar hook-associated protein 1 FlgK [Altererythrobacter atlanticus]|uniref:Flagellar hook-associated protein 1 n=1 Tax=Croceibacterium atlanticum TaxID=1267766 RepID=A0A0F7KZB4_9SPHN|nr:flagellar hook-associated protein FlgK [Croceibacterium atlanticum]AKH44175.1 Flagellar hook-associated protein 1 [Croceibacterium atlanticum]MBB5732486.1 flagellar hook-associated protein 1 FlgK [Croceibacterium atlanticum]